MPPELLPAVRGWPAVLREPERERWPRGFRIQVRQVAEASGTGRAMVATAQLRLVPKGQPGPELAS